MNSNSIRERINKYQEEIANLKSKHDRNIGVLQSSLKLLEENFNYKTIDSAEKALERWNNKKILLEKELEESILSFQNKYCR